MERIDHAARKVLERAQRKFLERMQEGRNAAVDRPAVIPVSTNQPGNATGEKVSDDQMGRARDGRSGARTGSATLPTSQDEPVLGVAGPCWSPKARERGLPTYPHCPQEVVEAVPAVKPSGDAIQNTPAASAPQE